MNPYTCKVCGKTSCSSSDKAPCPYCKVEWTAVTDALPPDGLVVMTKVSDSSGERNVQELKRMGGLWFLPDSSMYVYYIPTHWRRCKEADDGKDG